MTNTITSNKLTRSTELDILRIIAMFAVILVHAVQDSLVSPSDWRWYFFTTLGTFVTWQVPIFVMISGRFFLNPAKQITTAGLWKKNILKIVVCFCFWNVLYQAFYITSGTYSDLNFSGKISEALQGPYHFWFLYMIVGLYIITPFLRKFADDKQLMQMFILLFFVAEFLNKYAVIMPKIGPTLEPIISKSNYFFTLGYSGYFILGYYLYKYPLKKKTELTLYVLGVVAVITKTIVVITTRDAYCSTYLTPNVAIEASALYSFFIYRVSKINFSEKTRSIFSFISKHSMGVYLTHALVLDVLLYFGIHSLNFNPIIMLPVIIVAGFAISLAITVGLKKLGKLGKWIV